MARTIRDTPNWLKQRIIEVEMTNKELPEDYEQFIKKLNNEWKRDKAAKINNVKDSFEYTDFISNKREHKKNRKRKNRRKEKQEIQNY